MKDFCRQHAAVKMASCFNGCLLLSMNMNDGDKIFLRDLNFVNPAVAVIKYTAEMLQVSQTSLF